jgi:serine/threonine-protein kinase RsbW
MIMSEQNSLPLTMRLHLPASLQYLNILGACLKAVLVHVQPVPEWEKVSNNIWLAAHEICVNIVQHAYARQPEPDGIDVIIALNAQNDCLTIHLFDTGQPFDENCVKEPSLGEEQVHGYGLFLVRSLMDSVDYQRQESRNCWCLKKHLDRRHYGINPVAP